MDTRLKNKNSIFLAVLPFENLSHNEGIEFFCQSFRLDLITELSKFRQFSIIAEESVKKVVPGTETDNFSLLDTDYHISGTIRGHENKLIINAQFSMVNIPNRSIMCERHIA